MRTLSVGVVMATPTDHHPQLLLPPADRDHRPQETTDLRRAEEGLIHKSRLDLADIRRLYLSLLLRCYRCATCPPAPFMCLVVFCLMSGSCARWREHKELVVGGRRAEEGV